MGVVCSQSDGRKPHLQQEFVFDDSADADAKQPGTPALALHSSVAALVPLGGAFHGTDLREIAIRPCHITLPTRFSEVSYTLGLARESLGDTIEVGELAEVHGAVLWNTALK